jgi:hypothetical protein
MVVSFDDLTVRTPAEDLEDFVSVEYVVVFDKD